MIDRLAVSVHQIYQPDYRRYACFLAASRRLPAYFPPHLLAHRLRSALLVQTLPGSSCSEKHVGFHRANCESNVASYNSITRRARENKKEEEEEGTRDERGAGGQGGLEKKAEHRVQLSVGGSEDFFSSYFFAILNLSSPLVLSSFLSFLPSFSDLSKWKRELDWRVASSKCAPVALFRPVWKRVILSEDSVAFCFSV